jgi:hypothetical protein
MPPKYSFLQALRSSGTAPPTTSQSRFKSRSSLAIICGNLCTLDVFVCSFSGGRPAQFLAMQVKYEQAPHADASLSSFGAAIPAARQLNHSAAVHDASAL